MLNRLINLPLLFCLSLLITNSLIAQQVGIGTTTPNASAILVTHSALAAATADRVLLLSRDGLTDITGNKEFESCK